MKQLTRYVSRSVLSAMLLVLLLLLGLEVVFSFIGELEDVKGAYTATEALIYILLSAPGRAYDLLPTAALIGGIAGLGMLASASELTVMRASGVSILRLVWWVLRPALLFVLAGVLMAQYVVPKTDAMAETRKATAQGNSAMAGWLNSYWHREGDALLRIGRVDPAGVLHGLVFFRFSPEGRLQESTLIENAYYEGGQWRLSNLRETRFQPDGSSLVVVTPERIWPSQLTPEFLQLVTRKADNLSITDLYRYAHYMQKQGLDAGSYYLEFWKKTLAPLATLSMVLIACSFIFGPLRSVTMGLRILAGVMAGLLFRYGQDFLGYASLVYDFSPVLAAGLPIAACLLIGGVAIARVK
ncbi:MAG: LPS export ABC transporter permease LptG [Pedobacter sp.]|nr:LPS export ABC transporter permease LptG [Pedobacter sp.]